MRHLISTILSLFLYGHTGLFALDFSEHAHWQTSALSHKLSQTLREFMGRVKNGNERELIASLLANEPLIRAFRDMLSMTERAHYRSVNVRYSPYGIIPELDRLILAIEEIKEALPEQDLVTLRELQSEQQAYEQYPGVQHPENPTVAALIQASPKLILVGFFGLFAYNLFSSLGKKGSSSVEEAKAKIDSRFEEAEGKVLRKLQEFHDEAERKEMDIDELNATLDTVNRLLREVENSAGTYGAQVRNATTLLDKAGRQIKELKDNLPRKAGWFSRGHKDPSPSTSPLRPHPQHPQERRLSERRSHAAVTPPSPYTIPSSATYENLFGEGSSQGSPDQSGPVRHMLQRADRSTSDPAGLIPQGRRRSRSSPPKPDPTDTGEGILGRTSSFFKGMIHQTSRELGSSSKE